MEKVKLDSNTEISDAPKGISENDVKKVRQQLIKQVKDAKIELIKNVMEHRLPFHLIAPHDEKYSTGIVGLWLLGYSTSQVSRMTSMDEASVLGCIRLHYADFQTEAIRELLNSEAKVKK
jgi:hypothetical protein